jgi:hypothetical protein
MAMMTISPRMMDRRGDCKLLPDPAIRRFPSAGAPYASGGGGPDPAVGGGRG